MRDTPFSWTRIARRVIRVPDGMSAASDMEKLVEPTWSILMPLRNTVKGSICWSNKVAVNSTFLQCICLVWTFIKKAIRMGKINDENSEAAAPTSETLKVAHSWTLKVLHSKHPMESDLCWWKLSWSFIPTPSSTMLTPCDEGEQLYHFRQAGAKQYKNLWWFLTGKTQLIRCLHLPTVFFYHYWTHLFNLQVPVRKPSCQPQPPQDDQAAHPSNALPSKVAHEERFFGWNDLLLVSLYFQECWRNKTKVEIRLICWYRLTTSIWHRSTPPQSKSMSSPPVPQVVQQKLLRKWMWDLKKRCPMWFSHVLFSHFLHPTQNIFIDDIPVCMVCICFIKFP